MKMSSPAVFTPFYLSDFCSQTITGDCTATFSYIDTINDQVFPVVQDIVKTNYFRYFIVDFDKECQFWNEEHFCATQNCAIEMLPTMQINWDNAVLNDSPLGIETTINYDSNNLQSDLDYCIFDTKGDYVSLLDNPERFTGYAGKQAHNVWDAIYKENCFKVEDDECSTKNCSSELLVVCMPPFPLIYPMNTCLMWTKELWDQTSRFSWKESANLTTESVIYTLITLLLVRLFLNWFRTILWWNISKVPMN